LSTEAEKKPGPRLVALAEVTRPHGVKGEIRLKLYNRDSDLLLDFPEVVLEYPDGERRAVTVESARRANDAALLQLEGCVDREGAEELRGAKVLVPRESFPEAADGEFYVCDVIGARVMAPDGEIGVVEEFQSYPTVDALVVRTPRGKVEIPLVDDVIESLDVEAGVVRVHSSEGLGGE
jgi:16S rRNA processing protein RimM